MSLPYYKQFGWEAEVVVVDPHYLDSVTDELLLHTVDKMIPIHYVKAFSKKFTMTFGLGSIALRSMYHYRKKVDDLLKKEKFDLIYFSTTQFPICILGAYWRRRFNIPYVIDMQDPWFSTYYEDKPKNMRPRKYWFSHNLNKILEPIALKSVSGIISVSQTYIDELIKRYPEIKKIPAEVITFGASEVDLVIAIENNNKFPEILVPGFTNIVYVGRGGFDMCAAVTPLFSALQNCILSNPHLFKKIKLYFIGTSYAPKDRGKPSFTALAKKFDLASSVIELTNRISYFQTLLLLQKADALFIPGSDDAGYTASKIYPYLLTKKPLLAIIHSESPANEVLKEYNARFVFNFNLNNDLTKSINLFLSNILKNDNYIENYAASASEKYSAKNLTQRQCNLFDTVIKRIR